MQEDDYKMDMPDGSGADRADAPHGSGFSLDDILAEYKQTVSEKPRENESRSERSRRIVMQALDQTINEASFSSIDELVGHEAAPIPPEDEAVRIYTPRAARPPVEPEQDEEDGEREEKQDRAGPRLVYDGREYTIRNLVDSDEREQYAAKDYPEPELSEDDEDDGDDGGGRTERAQERRNDNARERFLSPIVAMLALIAIRRGQRKRADTQSPTIEAEDEDIPEMEPERAAKLYASQAHSLKLRSRLAAAVSLVMAYITFAWYSVLPLFGALGNSMRASSITLLIMQLTVMVIGLDVLTSGVMAAVRAKPAIWRRGG